MPLSTPQQAAVTDMQFFFYSWVSRITEASFGFPLDCSSYYRRRASQRLSYLQVYIFALENPITWSIRIDSYGELHLQQFAIVAGYAHMFMYISCVNVNTIIRPSLINSEFRIIDLINSCLIIGMIGTCFNHEMNQSIERSNPKFLIVVIYISSKLLFLMISDPFKWIEYAALNRPIKSVSQWLKYTFFLDYNINQNLFRAWKWFKW